MESFEYSETTTSPPNQLTPQARELLTRDCFGETVVYACTPRFWPVWRRTVYGIAVMSLMFVIAIVSLCVFFAIEEYDSSKRSQLWFLSVMGSIIVIFPLSIPCGAYPLWLYYRTYFALTPDEILLNKVRATTPASCLHEHVNEQTWLTVRLSLVGCTRQSGTCWIKLFRVRYEDVKDVSIENDELLITIEEGLVRCIGLYDNEFVLNYIKRQRALKREEETPTPW